jgi:hypothetical protein
MTCESCGSTNVSTFVTEANIHFPLSLMKDLEKPGVLLFPNLTICLDCGFAHCTLSEQDLRLLREGRAA